MAARKPTTKAPEGYATTGLPSRKVVQAVLKDINRIRKAEGWPPVRALLRGFGTFPYGQTCPVARTVGFGAPAYEVGVSHARVRVQRASNPFYCFMARHYPTSEATEVFIRAFDAGRYPGLRAPHA